MACLYKNLATLGVKRGPVLFQLPPFLKKDTERLQDFLKLLPEGHLAPAVGELQQCRLCGVGRAAGGHAVAGGVCLLQARADGARLRGGAAGEMPSVLRPAFSVCLQLQ